MLDGPGDGLDERQSVFACVAEQASDLGLYVRDEQLQSARIGGRVEYRGHGLDGELGQIVPYLKCEAGVLQCCGELVGGECLGRVISSYFPIRPPRLWTSDLRPPTSVSTLPPLPDRLLH